MVDPKKPSRRLTLQDAIEVWLRRWQGHLQHRIAAHFGCNQGRISEILTGKRHPKARDEALRLRGA
jgi:predicted XRE-type DNA-binding protein